MKFQKLLILSFLLSILAASLSAQVVTTRVDSIVGYVFTSEVDSVRGGIQIFTRTDSLQKEYETEWQGNWDAGLAQWSGRSIYDRVFDLDGNMHMYTWTHKREGDNWTVLDSSWIDYDLSGHIIFKDIYRWDEGQGGLIGHDREEYFRDAAGNDTLQRSSEWYETINDWNYSALDRRKFDQDNRLLEGIVYTWNWNLEEWELNGGVRFEYILSASGDVETKYQYTLYKHDMTWDTVTIVEYSYDASHNMLMEEGYVLMNGNWELRFKQEWEYDMDGNMTLHIPYWWDHANDSLGFRQSYSLSYDSQGRLLQRDNRLWDRDQSTWLVDRQTLNSYYEGGQLISNDYKDWNVMDGGEFRHSRIEYLYTSDGKDSISIHSNRDSEAEELVLTYKSFYYYGTPGSKDYTGIPRAETPGSGDFNLYPVPVRDYLMIDSRAQPGHVDILDLNGRTVLSVGRSEGGLDLSSLKTGIYLVRLKDKEGKLMGIRKILKE